MERHLLRVLSQERESPLPRVIIYTHTDQTDDVYSATEVRLPHM